MNTQLRRVAFLIVGMFVVLMCATTFIQFFQASSLNADGRNVRSVYAEYNKARGAIVVDGNNVAYSEKTTDSFGYQRIYNDSDVYSAITGYLSVSNVADRGVEAGMNDSLNGDSSSQWWTRLKSMIMSTQSGGSVELTINSKIQQAAYDALGDRKGAVVAIEPSTGKILAMVSKPSYDANTLAVHNTQKASSTFQTLANDEDDPLINRTISSLYPPGSTFKVIVSAAAIESGNYTKDSVLSSPQYYLLPGTNTKLPNYANEVCSVSGQMTMQAALGMSCNTTFAKLGVALGSDTINEQAKKFGVGDSFTVAWDNSSGYPMSSVKSYFPTGVSDDKVALASIGQGDTKFTPLQNALVAAAIANDGVLMKPYLVSKVMDSDLNVVSETTPTQYSVAVSSDTAKQLTEMMETVVSSTGSAPNAQISGTTVAGKTGTAETSEGTTPHAWFIGFTPAEGKSKIAVAVVIEDGENDPTGASAAAPVAKKVMEAALNN